MDLVDDDVRYAAQAALQSTQQDADGAEEDRPVRTRKTVLKANAVSGRFAQLLAALRRHAVGHGRRRDPARLRHHHRALRPLVRTQIVIQNVLAHLHYTTANTLTTLIN